MTKSPDDWNAEYFAWLRDPNRISGPSNADVFHAGFMAALEVPSTDVVELLKARSQVVTSDGLRDELELAIREIEHLRKRLDQETGQRHEVKSKPTVIVKARNPKKIRKANATR